jgi:hypothetical protein
MHIDGRVLCKHCHRSHATCITLLVIALPPPSLRHLFLRLVWRLDTALPFLLHLTIPLTRSTFSTMVQSQGVDVYITPYIDITRRYKEYSVPATSPGFTGNTNEVYIEAVDGERFAVVVDLKDDYDAKGGDRLIIKSRFDETVEAWRHSYGPLSEDVPTGSGLKGRCIIEETDRQVGGSLVKCGYAFAPLKTGTLHTLSPGILLDLEH